MISPIAFTVFYITMIFVSLIASQTFLKVRGDWDCYQSELIKVSTTLLSIIWPLGLIVVGVSVLVWICTSMTGQISDFLTTRIKGK